ncbi:hypothetical protein PEB0122_022210 [Bartonella apis]|nr:hypothetical protein PEB0122_022210 [Bartonella apis]
MIYRLIGGFVVGCLIGIGAYQAFKWALTRQDHKNQNKEKPNK